MPAVYLAGSHKAGLFVRNKTALISLRSGLFSMRLVTQSFITGTYTGFPDGVMINARMIDLQSKVVMSSAQGFLPTDDVEGIMGGYDATRNFKGKIIEQHVAPSVYLYNTKLVK